MISFEYHFLLGTEFWFSELSFLTLQPLFFLLQNIRQICTVDILKKHEWKSSLAIYFLLCGWGVTETLMLWKCPKGSLSKSNTEHFGLSLKDITMNTFKMGAFELITKIIYFYISFFQVMIINRHTFLIPFPVILTFPSIVNTRPLNWANCGGNKSLCLFIENGMRYKKWIFKMIASAPQGHFCVQWNKFLLRWKLRNTLLASIVRLLG